MSKAEEQFLFASGVAIGTAKHLGEGEHKQLLVEVMSEEAVATSAIEGEVLDSSGVRSLLWHQFGMESPSTRSDLSAEKGMAEMMVDLDRSFSQPLSDEMLFGWQRMATSARTDPAGMGGYRTSREPMRLISGPIDAPTIHFEAPPAKQVPAEMKRFVSWFNRWAVQGEEPLPAITRAGAAYLYFDSIHPFEEGNGRIARAIAQKALMQGFGQPLFIALAPAILANPQSYYQALLRANRSNEITEWLLWFAKITLQAQRQTILLVDFMIAKTTLLDWLRGQINERQRQALMRMFSEGPEGFKSGMTAGNYSTITGASPATTTRDLADLTCKGALIRTGERKHARYTLNLAGPTSTSAVRGLS